MACGIKPNRLRCLVPFCKRTTAETKWAEWVCAKHWKIVDKRIKRLRRAAQRRGLKKLDDWLWLRAKKQVLDRSL